MIVSFWTTVRTGGAPGIPDRRTTVCATVPAVSMLRALKRASSVNSSFLRKLSAAPAHEVTMFGGHPGCESFI